MKLGGETSFLLESVEGGERWGRYSFIALDPFLVMTARGSSITWQGEAPSVQSSSPLEAFREAIESFTTPDMPGLPPFFAGAVGYMGYDMVRHLEDIPNAARRELDTPDMLMMFPRTVVCFDHLRQRMTIVTLASQDFSSDKAEAVNEKVASVLAEPAAFPSLELQEQKPRAAGSTMTKDQFEAAVGTAKNYILAGDIFQVVLSHRLSQPLAVDPFQVYRVLRLVNPSPYMFFLRHPEITVTGSSPEPLIRVQDRKVVQRPIAGTRPRGDSEGEDDTIEEELRSDPKERAEHVMLVDLARNDIGRVSEYGSVVVEELMTVERYSHVMHLVSQVSGLLRSDCSPLDALYASFPAGTVSGAPKIRAMEIIDELEAVRRGPYAGIVGYFDTSGNLDTCIALRTAYIVDGRIHVQAGAGIVADSDPASEWQETLDKAKALLTAIAIADGGSRELQ